MTATIGRNCGVVFSPYFAQAASAPTAVNIGTDSYGWLTYSTARTPTWGGRVVRIDGTVAGGGDVPVAISCDGAMSDPDTTKRWCSHYAFIYYTDSATAAGYVAYDQNFQDSGGTGAVATWGIYMNGSGNLTLRLFTTGSGVGGAYTESSATSFALAANTEYYFTIDAVQVSGGVALSTLHWVMRCLTPGAAGSAPTLQATIEMYGALPTGYAGTGNVILGTYISGVKHDYAHIYAAVEDADNLAGCVRAAWYQPNANGAENAANWSLTNTVNWQEVPPDSATTKRDNTTNGAKATSTLTAGAGSTVPDVGAFCVGVCVESAEQNTGSGAKGGTANLQHMIGDGSAPGTHEQFSGNLNANTYGTWIAAGSFFHVNGAGAQFAQADIATLEIGVKGVLTGSGTGNSVTSIQAMVGWVKSGESLPAVPTPDSVSIAFPRTPIRNLLVTR